MVNVLEVFGEPFSNGGQESFTINVLNNIDMTDLHIDFYTPYYCDNDFYKSIVEKHGGKVIEAGLKFMPGSSRLDIIRPLKKLMGKEKYDVVHIHSGSISCLAYSALAARLCGVKRVIVHSHATGRKSLKYYLIRLATMPLMHLLPTDYFACSEEAGKWKFPGSICKNKLQVVNNGIDVRKFVFDNDKRKNMREALAVNDECFLVGHVGRLSKEKNHSFMIDVMYELIKKSDNSKMIFIGEGEEADSIKLKIDSLGLRDYIILQGAVPNVNDYLMAMDCFLFPSVYEGLGIAAIEAQASGLKTFCSDNVPDSVKITDMTEFVSLSDSSHEWAEKLLECKNGYLRTDMSEKIKQSGFDIMDTVRFLKKIYLSEK